MKFRIGGVISEDLDEYCKNCQEEINKLLREIGRRYRERVEEPIIIRLSPDYSPTAGESYVIVRGWHIDIVSEESVKND